MGAKTFVNSKYKCHKTFPNLILRHLTTTHESTDSEFFLFMFREIVAVEKELK